MDGLDGLEPNYDVVVVGARAAGAATAMLLARRGLRVLAVDRGVYGSDTLSTHALMRAGVLQLARWGVLDAIVAAGTPAVRRTVFHYDDEVVDVPIKPKDGVPALFAPRRTLLDRVLVDAAVAAGAEVRHRVRLADLLFGHGGRVDGVLLTDVNGGARAIHASLVVGADGLRSSVATLVDAPVTRRGMNSAATLYGYWAGLDVDGYHWFWGASTGAGVIPTNDGEALVFAGFASGEFGKRMERGVPRAYRSVVEEVAPELTGALASARLVGPIHGFAGTPGILRRPWGHGWALVGDAASFKDPITAHGISDALRDAELLAAAILDGSEAAFGAYEDARDAFTVGLFDVSDAVATFAWDTPRLKELHHALSDEMKKEAAAIAGWSTAPAALALAS
jgi:flavin-dependent dehydrogenase